MNEPCPHCPKPCTIMSKDCHACGRHIPKQAQALASAAPASEIAPPTQPAQQPVGVVSAISRECSLQWTFSPLPAAYDAPDRKVYPWGKRFEVFVAPCDGLPPARPAVKDHEIAQAVNQLRDIAIKFHDTQQLRERIAAVIVPLLQGKQHL